MSSIIGSSYASPYVATSNATKTPSKAGGSSSSGDQKVIDDFLAYQKLTPQQKIREALLKKLGLTEESLQSLPAADRKKVEDDIKEEIKKQIKTNLAEKGMLVDLLA